MGITSDKGLCGGVNSAVAKLTRLAVMEEEAKGNTAKIMMMGGKGVSAVKRLLGDRLTTSFEEIVKVPWSVTAACLIGERIIASNPARLSLTSNKFKSMVAYDTVTKQCVTLAEAQ